MLVAKLNSLRIEATNAERRSDFVCPECSGLVILKRGMIRIAHFAHKPPFDCDYGAGESEHHRSIKLKLLETWRERGVKAEIEWPVELQGQKRVVDVALWKPLNDRLYAIEVVQSNDELQSCQAKAVELAKNDLPTVWLPIVRKEWRDSFAFLVSGSKLEKFQPSAFERWLHGFMFGQIIFAYPPNELICCRFGKHTIHVDGSEWFDVDEQEEKFADSYTYASKRWKTLTVIWRHKFDEVGLSNRYRSDEFVTKNYTYPVGPFGIFVPAKNIIPSCSSQTPPTLLPPAV